MGDERLLDSLHIVNHESKNNYGMSTIAAVNDTEQKIAIILEDRLIQSFEHLIESSAPGKRFCYQVFSASLPNSFEIGLLN